MTNSQFILMVFGLILSIFGSSWLNMHQIDKRIEELSKRIEAQLDALRTEGRQNQKNNDDHFKRVEADITEIKSELKRLFKPIV